MGERRKGKDKEDPIIKGRGKKESSQEGREGICLDGVTPICSRDVRGHQAWNWLGLAGGCLRLPPSMGLGLTVSQLESSESGRVRSWRAREAGNGAAEPSQ